MSALIMYMFISLENVQISKDKHTEETLSGCDM